MITLRLKQVVLLGLLAAITLAPGRTDAAQSNIAADVREAIPADCIFCMRITNLDFTISQIDQFMVGLSPLPMGLSILVRMQLAGILGDPQLAGVNMGGEFGAFSVSMPGATDPNAAVFTGVLIPVTSYEAFVASPNVGQPDARGVSQIIAQGTMMPIPPMAAKQAGAFALVTIAEQADVLATVADSISSGGSPAVASIPGIADSDTAGAPIWIYINAQKAADEAGKASAAQGGAMPMPAMAGMPNIDLAAALKDVPVETVTIGLIPTPDAITIMARVSTVPGTELAKQFVSGSDASTMIFEMIGAKSPNEIGSQMAAISALLPKAAQADVAGTFDVVQIPTMIDTLPIPIPISLPKSAVASKSGIAYAATLDNGNLAVDLVAPKDHVLEIAAYVKQIGPNGIIAEGSFESTEVTSNIAGGPFGNVEIDTTPMQPLDPMPAFDAENDEPDDDISMITASPFGDLLPSTVAPTKVTIPVMGGGGATSVQGRISGTDVRLDNGSYNRQFTLHAGDSWGSNPSLLIFLFLDEGTSPAGRRVLVAPTGDYEGSRPHVHYRWEDPASGNIESKVAMSGYRMDLQFGQIENGMLAGRIEFEVSETNTLVSGTFNVPVKNQALLTAAPPVQPQPDTSLFGSGFNSVTTPAVPTKASAEKVRVAGVRLIRYSDFKLGVLPLGRGDGYTLSLIADLPEPAVKISGGQIDKAITNNGASLLPEDKWDRKVRFGRLSKDHKTAIFDVELLLPDPGTLGIQELAGTLEYFTASGTKDVDLGLVDLKPGAKGSQLGARISSIEIDPYGNNAPIVGLTLDVPADAVESIELYDKSGQRLKITRYGSTSGANTTTIKFFVESKLPDQAKIIVHTFEGLQSHSLPFSIKAISIAGLPMR